MKFRNDVGFFKALGVTWLSVLFLLSFNRSANGQQVKTHAENDLEWSKLMQNAPAFVVDHSTLRVAAANELNQLGEWSEIIDWPHTAVSAANLPDGRILTYSSNEEDSWPGGQPEFTYAAAWDPKTGIFKMVPHNAHDMFCAELVMTDDGKVFVTGGRNHVPTTSVFDFESEEWSTIDDMNKGRWYPTSVSLPNGNVFTALGSSGGSVPEIWDKDSGWAFANGIDLTNPVLNKDGWTIQTWPYLFVAPSGELFHAGPTTQMHYLNLGSNGSIREAGSADKGWYGKRGLNVMYEENKIMIAGGSESFDGDAKDVATNAVVSIDISGTTPVLTPLASMNNPRITHNGVLLPNGHIIVVGGRSHGGGDTNSILTPEIYDPEANTWTEVADMSVPRNYHSTALLMPDGRVWSGGGGFCANGCPDITHSNAQVYSPPYLFNADGSLATRPVIDTAPESIRNNEVFTLSATAGLTQFTLVKMSAITHQMNTDLRRLYADFIETSPGDYQITAHSNPNVLTPGYWMLFGLDSNGVPSEAAIIQVSTEGAPQLTNPGIQYSNEGQLVSLQMDATDDDPLTFTATGLPPGLSMNGGTGEISGIPLEGAAGSYEVEVTATDAIGGVTVTFQWVIGRTEGEVGYLTTDQASSSQWHTVNLIYEYLSPVVVMGPPSYAGSNQTTVRVRNVTSNSFEFQLDEWDYLDGAHIEETISYMVIEAGTHQLSDGRTLHAGSLEASGNGWNSVSFSSTFSNQPVVLTQVGTANDEAAVTSRLRNVSVNKFEVQLEEEEGAANDHGQETIYWVAIESGVQGNDVPNEAGLTADVVDENWHTITFSQSYSTAPVFLGNFQTTDGGDPVTMRYRNLGSSGVEIFTEEEQAANDEIAHTQEIAGFVVFDATGAIPFYGYEIPPLVLASPGDQSGKEGEAVSFTIEVEQGNGNLVTFSASGLPLGVSIDSNTGVIDGGLVAGSSGTSTVTIEATDGFSSGSITFNWSIDPARGSWIDYTDDSNTLSVADDSEEKDIAVGDLNKDGWDDIIVVRKEGFMGTGARTDLLLMNEAGTLVDRTDDFAPGFAVEPTIARDAIITDLDGDGWDDVLIANTFGDQPKFYRNLGADATGWLGLADESTTRLPTLDVGTIQYCGVAAGDVTGDGSPDLYFSNYVMDGTTKDVLLINDGNGNFTDEGNDRLGELINTAFGTQASIIDIDKDGDNDIVKLTAESGATPFNDSGVYVLYNDGNGAFANWSTVPSDEPYMFIMEDFDNNGEKDFYIVDDAADYVNLSNGVTANSSISFTQQTTSWARTASNGANLRVGDLDGDGDLDIGVADVDTSFPPCETPENLRAFLLLENEGTHSGTFIDPFGAADKPWSKNMYDFAFVDVNNDGSLDIFSAECNGYGLFISTQDAVEPPEELATIVLGNLGLGVAAHDERTGPGYVMYSEESVHTRFADNPPSIWGADHLILVVFDGGQWNIDRNKMVLVSFTPRSSDRLLAEVDFEENIATELIGVNTAVEGIAAGYVSGNLVVTPETWGGNPDEGEFWIQGTEVVINGAGMNSSPVIAAIDDQSNNIDDTISLTLSASDSDGDQITFTADGLPTGLSLAGDQISGTLSVSGIFPVTISAADGNGGLDTESFTWTVDGGDPDATINIALGDLANGIAAHDQRTGTGYIMFSEESVHTRFADNPPSIWQADHLIAVVFEGGQWKVDRNKYTLVPFTPLPSDHLVASVDFGADEVTHLVGINTSVEGINAGYVSGDLVITPEMWAGSPNEGEFGLEGTTIEIPGEVQQAIARGDDPFVLTGPEEALPESFDLNAIYPNPFSGTTTVAYELPEDSAVKIEIFNITGQRIKTLINNNNMPAGTWNSLWDGTDESDHPVAAGLYLIRFQANGYTETSKVVMIK